MSCVVLENRIKSYPRLLWGVLDFNANLLRDHIKNSKLARSSENNCVKKRENILW